MSDSARTSERGGFATRRRQFLSGLVAVTGGLAVSGCGTIMYPERVGQPRGPLNWKVVALDTLGLLLFFIPGVIAFAVDFYNGTIYLPPEEAPWSQSTTPLTRKVPLPAAERNMQGVEQIVRRETGVKLDLQPGNYLTRKLNSLREVESATKELAMEWKESGAQVRCQSPDAMLHSRD